MSRPPEYDIWVTAGGDPQGPPNVYIPQAAPSSAYDGYADPAAAHGWRDADGTVGGAGDTRELPVVAEHGRAGGRRRSRRKPSAWRSRRVAVAAAAGAVSAAALIAGLSFSGEPSGGARGGGDRTSPATGEPATPKDTGPKPTSPRGAAAAVDRPSPGDRPSSAASPGSSVPASPTPSEPGTRTKQPSDARPTAAPTTTAPTATTSAPGNSEGKPGHGPGGTKGPK